MDPNVFITIVFAGSLILGAVVTISVMVGQARRQETPGRREAQPRREHRDGQAR
jgi:hypothetical protein